MKKLNWDKELKKVQKRGIYNPKVRVFSIIAIALLTLGIGLTFSAFSYSSGDVQAFNSQVKKKVKIVITVTNGSGTVNTTTNYQSSGTLEYSVTPNSGYIVDEDNTTCNYNSSTKKVIITPNADTNCMVMFDKPKLKDIILANNTLITSTPDFSKGEPLSSGTNTGSGLYTAEDDLGISYYFRGRVNNYVEFANKKWRIVRINGDKSIRLVLSDTIGYKQFNNNSEIKHVGYTYDNANSYMCSIDVPCVSNYNNSDKTFSNNPTTLINSNIKNELENWYSNNLNDYDKYISYGDYCNDTSSFDATNKKYGVYYRIHGTTDKHPTLKCPDTEQTYGGYYKLKIGLLSDDEILMAGIPLLNSGASNENYLYSTETWWTMTPVEEVRGYVIDYNYFYASMKITESWAIKPVINLKADIRIMAGNGTKDAPYEVG